MSNQDVRPPELEQRLPPFNDDAEKGVLGCCLLDPQEAIPLCIEKIGGEGGDAFYDLKHRQIYETIIELYNESTAVDLITLSDRLKTWGMLENIGNLPFLAALSDAVPSSANLGFYLEIVEEKMLLRKMLRVCGETEAKIYDFSGDTALFIDQVERDILKVGESRQVKARPSIKELVGEALANIEMQLATPGAVTGLRTGFTDLDTIISGMQQGEMIVIAGRPSTGKTSLAMNIAEFVACDLRLPVGVFSLEMTAPSLVQRMICCRADVNSRNIPQGILTQEDINRITRASAAIRVSPLEIDDQGGLSILQIRARARRMVQQYGIKLFVIDYLQLANAMGTKKRYENRQQEVTDISQGIKDMGKELKVPVIVLSQLNRGMENERARKPRLSDLRESGSIEQDADIVGMLYRPGQENDDPEPGPSDPRQINLFIAKQRNGPREVDVALTFFPAFTKFRTMTRIDDRDIPTQGQAQAQTQAELLEEATR